MGLAKEQSILSKEQQNQQRLQDIFAPAHDVQYASSLIRSMKPVGMGMFRMKTLTVSFKITKPEHVNKSDFVEWLRFELGRLDSIDENNVMTYAELRDLIKDVVIE